MAKVDTAGTRAVAGDGGTVVASRLTSEQVWREVAKASFAVLSHVTPSGAPRSSGVVFTTIGRRLYVAVDAEGWKARHIPARGQVCVTVLVRRGGVLSLVAPIPPATISFRGTATVHPASSRQFDASYKALERLLPPDHRDSAAIIEIVPEGAFVTYGLGVSLTQMRNPAVSQARVPVSAG
jgi:hypothetical protein